MPLTIPPYEGQGWTDNSTPDLSAETLNAVDDGIAAATDGVNAIAAAVVSQIINDPEKIASIAVAYAQQQQINTINTNLTTVSNTLNNKFLLNSNTKYLAIKQVSYPSTNGNDWVSVSLSQMGITGKKLAEYCAPMACISWNTGNNFWVVYCHQYGDTTLQVRFNTSSAGAFRVTLMFGLVDA